MSINTQTSFLYGSIGDRLDFNRVNDVYRNSAKYVEDGYVSQLGTLRVMKDVDLANDLAKDIVYAQETTNNLTLIGVTDELLILNSTTGAVISRIAATKNLTKETNIHINLRVGSKQDTLGADIKPYFLISVIWEDKTNKFFKCDEDGKNLVSFDFFANLSKPLEDKKTVYMDVYRVYSYAELAFGTDQHPTFKDYLTLQKVGESLEDPVISVENGKVSIDSVPGEVKRIYFEDKNNFIFDGELLADRNSVNAVRDIYIAQESEQAITDEKVFPQGWKDLKQGDVIVNFYNNKPNDKADSPLILLFKDLTFTGLTKPADAEANKGKFTGLKQYYTGVDFALKGKSRGKILEGNVIDISTDLRCVNTFQGRLVLMTKDTVYFSRIGEHEDFTNDVENPAPFFNKLSPISNVEPQILNSYSSRGLFVMTDRGIIVVNYQRVLTPSTISIDTVSDIPCTKHVEMIDYNLYHIGADGHVYAIQEDTETVSARLYSFRVEKFQLEQNVVFISKIKIDKQFRLIVIEKDVKNTIKLYSTIDVDSYSNVTYNLPHSDVVVGIKDSFFTLKGKYKVSDRNKETMKLTLHQPDLYTDNGGTLFNDNDTYITKMSARIINTDNAQIESFSCRGEPTIQLADNLGRSSLYQLDLYQPILDGIDVQIELKKDSKGIVELQGIEYLYNVASLY